MKDYFNNTGRSCRQVMAWVKSTFPSDESTLFLHCTWVHRYSLSKALSWYNAICSIISSAVAWWPQCKISLHRWWTPFALKSAAKNSSVMLSSALHRTETSEGDSWKDSIIFAVTCCSINNLLLKWYQMRRNHHQEVNKFSCNTYLVERKLVIWDINCCVRVFVAESFDDISLQLSSIILISEYTSSNAVIQK